jgi:hypothetical protein
MLTLLSRVETINHLHILYQTHHLLHVEINVAQDAFCVGVLVYGGTNLNILLMISCGVQIFMSVAADAIQKL